MYPLSRLLYPRDKALQEAFRLRNIRYNARLAELSRLKDEGRIFVIRPSAAIAVSRLEKDHAKIQAAYDLGVTDAQSLWAPLEKYLAAGED